LPPKGRKNANHDGVTQQIDDRLQGFETENTMLIQAGAAVHAARQGEDTAYRRYSGKDFASDDLKREDALEDKYTRADTYADTERRRRRLTPVRPE